MPRMRWLKGVTPCRRRRHSLHSRSSRCSHKMREASNHAQVYTGNMSQVCKCGYRLGEGYHANCKVCIDHNCKLPGRRAKDRFDLDFSDSADEFEVPKKRAIGKGIPQNVIQLGERASMRAFVKCAPQASFAEKTQSFFKSIPPKAATVPKRGQTLEEADTVLRLSGWRRCVTMENRRSEKNLEHDNYELVFTPRDGHCLFHCFRLILEKLGMATCHAIIDIPTMRGLIADFFEANNNLIQCSSVAEGGETFTLDYACESVTGIRTGMGGRVSYGGVNEIVAFCVKYRVAVTVFAPENGCAGEPPITYNPGDMDGEFPCESLLYTLAWSVNKKGTSVRSAGQDHWQCLKLREVTSPQQPQAPLLPVQQPQSPLVSVQQPQSPLLPVQQSQASPVLQLTTAQKKEAARLRAQEKRKADDDAACEQAKNFIAAGGKFDFTEPDDPKPVSQNKAPEVHEVSSANEGDDAPALSSGDEEQAGDGKKTEDEEEDNDDDDDDDDDEVEKEEENVEVRGGGEGGGGGRNSHSKAGDPGRAKKSAASATDSDPVAWTHDTQITFLDTIVAHNPFEKGFGSKSKIGDKWDAIAVAMAEDTKHLEENAVVTTGDALRVKFARIKLKCKNFRDGGKSQRQSGLAAVRDKQTAELADHMDGCLNLQKDAEHSKENLKTKRKKLWPLNKNSEMEWWNPQL